jgi:hypothetical protein
VTGSGLPPLDHGCGEQGKLPTAEAFKLAERDKSMSEARTFMQRVDEWTESTILKPLFEATRNYDHHTYEWTVVAVKKAVREKLLDSYKNGLKAKARPARKEARA